MQATCQGVCGCTGARQCLYSPTLQTLFSLDNITQKNKDIYKKNNAVPPLTDTNR